MQAPRAARHLWRAAASGRRRGRLAGGCWRPAGRSLSSVGHAPSGSAPRPQDPEFEHPGDGAAERHLQRPGRGGYSRGSFVKPHLEDVHTHYDFGDQLGQGAFGSVCTAVDRRTGELVAIKTIPKDAVTDMEALQLEIDLLKATDHPNIVRLYSVFEDEHSLWLVMEHCSGGELWKRILSLHECGLGFSEKELACYMEQMLRAVSYCHQHNIVHRDLKPQNFLFSSKEPGAPLRLVDFGASGVVGSCRGRQERYLTKVVGTDGYIAPEVLLSKPYGPPADLFSLGAVMHSTLTGVSPRWDEHAQAYAFPGKIRWRMLSKPAQALLQRLLSCDPDERGTAVDNLHDPWFTETSGEPGGNFLTDDLVERMCKFGMRSKLQRALMESVVVFSRLRSKESAHLQSLFLQLDTDGSGEVSKEELAEALRACRVEGSCEAFAKALVQAIDDSCGGTLTCSEWLAAASSQAWFSNQKGARAAFDALDADGDGVIGPEDLLQALPGVFEPGELREEIARLDANGDGMLDFEEFCALLSQADAPPSTSE